MSSPDPNEDLEVLSDLEGLEPAYSYETLAKDRYRDFIDQYLIDLDAQKAGRRCGFRTPNTATTLMNRADVRAVIDQRLAERSYRVQVTADDVLLKLWQMANARLSDLRAEDGSILPMKDWPEVFQSGLVQGFEQEDTYKRSHDGEVADEDGKKSWDKSGRITKIKLVDRLKLLELLGRHVQVKAFPQMGEKLGEGLTNMADAINSAIAEGRQRALRSKE